MFKLTHIILVSIVILSVPSLSHATQQLPTTLWPQTVTIAPGATFSFAPSGTNAPITLSVMSGGSGGTIDPNTAIYTAPNLTNSVGLDFIQAADASGNIATSLVVIAAAQSSSSGTSLSAISLAKGNQVAAVLSSNPPQIWYSATPGTPSSGFTKQTSALGLTHVSAGDTTSWGYLNWFQSTGEIHYGITAMNTAHFEIQGGATSGLVTFSTAASPNCQTVSNGVQCNLSFSFEMNVMYQFTLEQIPSDQPKTTLWDATLFDPTTFITYDIGRIYVPSSWGLIGSNGQANVSPDGYSSPCNQPFSEAVFGSPILFANEISSMSNIWSFSTGGCYNIALFPSETNSYVIIDAGK